MKSHDYLRLFGSFVGLFVARIGDADKKLWFRTQVFSPSSPAPASDDSRAPAREAKRARVQRRRT